MKTTYNSLSNEDFLLRLQKYDDSIPLEKYKGIHHYMRFKCKIIFFMVNTVLTVVTKKFW